MFAKPKNGRNVGRTRPGQSDRPVSLPGFLRSDPDGELATLYKRVKTACTKSKLPAGWNRREPAKLKPVTDEYANVKSKVSTFRRPFSSKQFSGEGIWKGVPPVPRRKNETTQNAPMTVYSKELIGDDFVGVGIKELGDKDEVMDDFPNSCEYSSYSRNKLDSIFSAGIAEVQNCKTTAEVFERFAKTFHDALDQMDFKAESSNSSTQTSKPRLQRTQLSFIYAGFWESCTSRENRGMQTEEQNLTFSEQPTVVLLENFSERKQTLGRKVFGWKCFGLIFLVSTIFLCLMEIPNWF